MGLAVDPGTGSLVDFDTPRSDNQLGWLECELIQALWEYRERRGVIATRVVVANILDSLETSSRSDVQYLLSAYRGHGK